MHLYLFDVSHEQQSLSSIFVVFAINDFVGRDPNHFSGDLLNIPYSRWVWCSSRHRQAWSDTIVFHTQQVRKNMNRHDDDDRWLMTSGNYSRISTMWPAQTRRIDCKDCWWYCQHIGHWVFSLASSSMWGCVRSCIVAHSINTNGNMGASRSAAIFFYLTANSLGKLARQMNRLIR